MPLLARRKRRPVKTRKRATPAMKGVERLIVSESPPGDTFWRIVVGEVCGRGAGVTVAETTGKLAEGVEVTWTAVGSGDGSAVVWTVVWGPDLEVKSQNKFASASVKRKHLPGAGQPPIPFGQTAAHTG